MRSLNEVKGGGVKGGEPSPSEARNKKEKEGSGPKAKPKTRRRVAMARRAYPIMTATSIGRTKLGAMPFEADARLAPLS